MGDRNRAQRRQIEPEFCQSALRLDADEVTTDDVPRPGITVEQRNIPSRTRQQGGCGCTGRTAARYRKIQRQCSRLTQ